MIVPIPCPSCGGSIALEPHLLAAGASFECSSETCDASVALDLGNREKFSKALSEYEQMGVGKKGARGGGP